jgi:hypothetical protein
LVARYQRAWVAGATASSPQYVTVYGSRQLSLGVRTLHRETVHVPLVNVVEPAAALHLPNGLTVAVPTRPQRPLALAVPVSRLIHDGHRTGTVRQYLKGRQRPYLLVGTITHKIKDLWCWEQLRKRGACD